MDAMPHRSSGWLPERLVRVFKSQEGDHQPGDPHERLVTKEDRNHAGAGQHDPRGQQQDDRATHGDGAVSQLEDSIDGGRPAAHRRLAKRQSCRESSLEPRDCEQQHSCGQGCQLHTGHLWAATGRPTRPALTFHRRAAEAVS